MPQTGKAREGENGPRDETLRNVRETQYDSTQDDNLILKQPLQSLRICAPKTGQIDRRSKKKHVDMNPAM